MDDHGKQNRQIHKDKYEFCLMCDKGIRGHQSKSGKRTWGKELTGGVKYDGGVLYVYIDMSS